MAAHGSSGNLEASRSSGRSTLRSAIAVSESERDRNAGDKKSQENRIKRSAEILWHQKASERSIVRDFLLPDFGVSRVSRMQEDCREREREEGLYVLESGEKECDFWGERRKACKSFKYI